MLSIWTNLCSKEDKSRLIPKEPTGQDLAQQTEDQEEEEAGVEGSGVDFSMLMQAICPDHVEGLCIGDGVELTGIHHTDSQSVDAMTTQFLLCLNISAFHIFNKIQLFLSSQVSCHFSRDRSVKFLVYVFERKPSILDTAIVWIMPE